MMQAKNILLRRDFHAVLSSPSGRFIFTLKIYTLYDILNHLNNLERLKVLIVAQEQWWESAVFYQIYPRSFMDANGDGVGDIPGIASRLGYLELLEVDAIWLSPVMKSPQADHGYDVSDPRDIDPLFGSISDLENLIEEAHSRGIKVLMDLVPNHTSIEHPWFQEALASPPHSPQRARYHFKDGLDDGQTPPNNWPATFGGPAWTRIHDKDGNPEQWYLHLFAPEQPDLNWENPEVWEDLETTLTFWLDKGIDGFRIDVAHGMAKPEGLPDGVFHHSELMSDVHDDVRFNQPHVHDIHRKIRQVLNRYPGTMAVGEIWVRDNESFSHYVRPDELHLGFNFRLAEVPFDAEQIRQAINDSIAAVSPAGAYPTWALSNHDVSREVSRYAVPENPLVGLDRARALFLVIMALPGSVFIYQGAELGLPNAYVPEELRQDPMWERSGHTIEGRDGLRVPFPWESQTPPFGFSTQDKTWLPIPQEWSAITAEKQLEDPYSTFSLYRATIEVKKNHNNKEQGKNIEWFEAPENCLAFRRENSDIICAFNGSGESIALPPGQVILSSAPLQEGTMPPNSAVWIKNVV